MVCIHTLGEVDILLAFWITFCGHGVYRCDISSAHVVVEKVAHRLKFHSFFTISQAIQPILIVMNSIWFLHTENVHLGLPVQTKLYNVAHINANIVNAVTCM